MTKRAVIWSACVFALTVSAVPLTLGLAAWEPNGNPICTASTFQQNPVVVSDGAQGAIIAWWDYRDPNATLWPRDIFVQRVDPKGDVLWMLDGMDITSAEMDIPDEDLGIAVDGEGGAIIAWVAHSPGETAYGIFAQRVDSLGTPLWPLEGVPICTTGSFGNNIRMIPHHEGGAIIAWEDTRSGVSNHDVYAQRVDGYGNTMWTTNGEPVCTASGDQSYPTIVPDGYGGAIIAWADYRNTVDYDIYAQRLDGLGASLWPSDGTPVCTAIGHQNSVAMLSLGTAGAILCWADCRNSPTDSDIYGQRLDLSGSPGWGTDGAPVSNAPAISEIRPVITSDGGWGAIIAWEDERYSGPSDMNIFAQKMNFTGQRQWTIYGKDVCTAVNVQDRPRITSDGFGGAIIAWEDERTDTLNVYAQHLDALGDALWVNDGIPVCSAYGIQHEVQLITDHDAGAFVVWSDGRAPSEFDIYAQRIRSEGTLEPDSLPDARYSFVELMYPICPDSRMLILPSEATGALVVIVKNEYDEPIVGAEVGASLMSTCGICRCEPFTGTTLYDGSAFLPIRGGLDASGSTACCEVTAVVFCMGVPIPWFEPGGALEDTRIWLSPDLNGDCVVDSQDSLIIRADLPSTACRTDFDCSGFVDEVLDYTEIFLPLLGSACTPVIDVAEKKQPATPLSALVQNYPNPFNPLTHIVFSIREAGWVVLRVYDIAGRPVRTLVNGWLEPQHYELTWDGRDDAGNEIASGVYFYKLEAPGHKESKKMILLR